MVKKVLLPKEIKWIFTVGMSPMSKFIFLVKSQVVEVKNCNLTKSKETSLRLYFLYLSNHISFFYFLETYVLLRILRSHQIKK
jgi:hypothetical protein